MESPNLHRQHQHPPSSSSSSSSSSYGSTTHHSWPPNNNITFHIQEDNNNNLRWRGGTLRYHHDDVGVPVPLIQDHQLWTTTTRTSSSDDNSAQQSCLTLNTTNNNHMLNSHHTPPSTTMECSSTHDKTFLSAQDLIYSNNNITTTFCGGGVVPTASSGSSRRNFSHIYPTINISNNMNNHSPSSPNNNNMMMMTTSHSLDLPAFITASHHQQVDLALATFSDNLSFRLDHHHSHHHRPPTHSSSPPPCSNTTTTPTTTAATNNNNNPSQYFSNGTTSTTVDTKRPCTSIIDTKASQSLTASKKSRSESRPSCPPFKVRKEKLGDRIAALQQLVAPFGKTDTASVLMEAIGYIKFLQSQVETLSVPYMKPSQNQTNTRIMQGVSAIGGGGNGEPKQDLRSRGLCLVPLSCMCYIAGDGSNDAWQQSNCGGPT